MIFPCVIAPGVPVAEIFAKHPEVTAQGYVQSSTNCIAYTSCPETMEQLAGLLRDLRASFPEHELRITKQPDQGRIHYYLGPVYLVAALARKCTFKKVGVETVEKPVYELVCE